jgi:hypothetical protein
VSIILLIQDPGMPGLLMNPQSSLQLAGDNAATLPGFLLFFLQQ